MNWFWKNNAVTWFVDNTQKRQNTMREQKSMGSSIQRNNDSKESFQNSLNTTDVTLQNKYNSMCNAINLSEAIVLAAQSHGIHDYDNLEPAAITDRFLEKNKWKWYENYVNDCMSWRITLWEAVSRMKLDRLPISDDKKITRRANPLTVDISMDNSEYNDETNGNIWANIAQSLIDVPMNLVKLPFNLIDKWTARVAKQFSDDDEAIDQALQENLQRTENFATLPWVNREDLSYQIPNITADLWVTILSSFIPWFWEAKWAEFSTKFPKFAKLLKVIWGTDKMYEKYPWIAKFLIWWKIWAKDVTVMNALEWEWTSPLELLEWWLAWWIIEKGMWGLKKLSAYLETNWLLKPSVAENIIKKMKDRWELWWKMRDITWLADFMTEYWLVWTKQQVRDKALQLASDKRNVLMDLIKIADKTDAEKWITHSLPEADEAIDLLKKMLEKSDGSPVIPRKEQLDFFNEMIKKRWIWDENWLFSNVWKYSLSDLQRLKNELDDLYKIYDNAWSVLEKQQAAYWHEERKAIKEYIENEIKKRKLWDISKINNEIATAYEIWYWVEERALSESVNRVSSVADKISDWAWPAAWIYLWASAINDLKEWDIKWALTKWLWIYLLNNTYFKTHLWSFINRLTWASRKEMQEWIDSEWRTALSEEASEAVANIIKRDESLMNKVKEFTKQYMSQIPKESSIVWVQKWAEELVDSYNN